jgi:hypothetical protein
VISSEILSNTPLDQQVRAIARFNQLSIGSTIRIWLSGSCTLLCFQYIPTNVQNLGLVDQVQSAHQQKLD